MAQHCKGIKAKLAKGPTQSLLKINEKLRNRLLVWVTSPLAINEINLSGSNNTVI